MILFQDRANDIQVIRTKNCRLGVDYIGVLRQPDTGAKNPDWVWYFYESIWDSKDVGFNEVVVDMSPSEKLCIIGMLDKLNNFGYRKIGTRTERWRKITGLPEATF